MYSGNHLGKRPTRGGAPRKSNRTIIVIVMVMLLVVAANVLPWALRQRHGGGHKLPPNGNKGASIKKESSQRQDGKDPREDDGEKKPANDDGGEDVESTTATTTTEEAEELLDSLTAQQLIDGGYTYRSYAEMVEADAADSVIAADGAKGAVAGTEEDDDNLDNDDDETSKKKRKETAAKGKASAKKGSSRSIAKHEFSIAKPYDAARTGRVCDRLAANVSLSALRAETARIGTYQEYWYTGDIDISPEEALGSEAKAAEVMALRTRRPTAAELRKQRGGGDEDVAVLAANNDGGKAVVNTNSNGGVVKYAYVLMISNHKYVDGALVVAQSLRQHSEMVKSGEADLVLIISEKIKMSSVRLLTRVFTRVKIMYSMATFAPQSYYKTTFDKIYLFWLTEYKVLLFMDADSLVTGNPDGLLIDKENEGDEAVNRERVRLGKKPKRATPLTAVGGGDYFQTGLLIAKPDRQLFTDLYLEFRLGAFGYNQWRARDGVLIRTCLMQHHSNIEHPIDRLYHFYGFVKPWFNKDGIYKYGKGDDKLTFGPQYWDWWRRYEELHNRYFITIAAVEQAAEEKRSGKKEYYGEYVYGNSANYPEKEVPIAGLSLRNAITGESTPVKKTKGGWGKFDITKVKKDDFPQFYSNISINSNEALLVKSAEDPSSITAAERVFMKNANKPQYVTNLIDPTKYMWIQRFSVGAEYFRPTYSHYASIFNSSVEAVSRRFMVAEKLGGEADSVLKSPSPFASVIVGAAGDSCTATCTKHKGKKAAKKHHRKHHRKSHDDEDEGQMVKYGRCVPDALRATTINDCFYGYAEQFAHNQSVRMAHGTVCDICTYEYRSEAAPFIFPTTAEGINEHYAKLASGGGSTAAKKLSKKEKKRLRKLKKEQLAAAADGDAGRVHQQEAAEGDDEEAEARRRVALAQAVESGVQLNECRVNYNHEKMLWPTCDAKKDGASRVCVCV